jgi:hypothetical protein
MPTQPDNYEPLAFCCLDHENKRYKLQLVIL